MEISNILRGHWPISMLFKWCTIWFLIHSERNLLPAWNIFILFTPTLSTPSVLVENIYCWMTSLVNLECSASLSCLLTIKNQKKYICNFSIDVLRPDRCGVKERCSSLTIEINYYKSKFLLQILNTLHTTCDESF